MSKCRGCSAPIVWAETEQGKRMPLDATPLKRAVRVPSDRGEMVVRIEDTWTPHWATCPVASSFKRAPQGDLFGKAGG